MYIKAWGEGRVGREGRGVNRSEREWRERKN